MGQIVKLINFDKMMRYAAVGGDNNYSYDNNWTDITGTTGNGYASNYSTSHALSPWNVPRFGITFTSQTTNSNFTSNNPALFPHPSSDSDIPYNSTTVPNEISATTSVAYTRDANGNGWTANITITGTSENDETVRSLVFTKVIVTSYSSGSGNTTVKIGVLFAYILDSPITLNAENNYTANLTVSVKFE